MTTTFQQRHYEAIADFVYFINEESLTKEELVNKFVNLFASDNYKFKESIFRNWCANYHGNKKEIDS